MLPGKIMELVQKAEDAIIAGDVEVAKVYAQLVQGLSALGGVRGPMAREFMGGWGPRPGPQPGPPGPQPGPPSPRVTNLDYRESGVGDDPEAPDSV